MNLLPKLVLALVHGHDAWIIGSAAHPDSMNDPPRDWDGVVPYKNWQEAQLLIPKDAKVNSFGGWKCISDNDLVDVWPADLSWIMQAPLTLYMWHPRTGTRFKRLLPLT